MQGRRPNPCLNSSRRSLSWNMGDGRRIFVMPSGMQAVHSRSAQHVAGTKAKTGRSFTLASGMRVYLYMRVVVIAKIRIGRTENRSML